MRVSYPIPITPRPPGGTVGPRVHDGHVDALEGFTPATRSWFAGAFAAPTAAQEGAWAAARAGRHALVVAPTGSGKTLAAFLWALDRLVAEPPPVEPKHRCRVLYVSPLKALAVDVERNLRSPLAGIRQAAHRLGLPMPEITVGMRTGDTAADERRRFARTPPDVLVTTPESLFLLLTSAARESLRGVRTVIVDEVHAVAGTKRGAHLALSLERLDELLRTPPGEGAAGEPGPAQRIGLSATVRPVDEVSSFLAGSHPVQVIRPAIPKTIEVTVEVPVPDLAALDVRPDPGSTDEEIIGSAAGSAQRPSIWPAVERRVLELVRAHRSTIVFANSRRLAERLTSKLNELAAESSASGTSIGTAPDGEIDPSQLTDADRWILDRVGAVTAEVDALLEDFQFAKATELLYHFTWDEFCDWYLELAKVQIGQGADVDSARAATTRAVLGNTLDVLLRLLHPIMPFLTETLWTALTGGESLVVASWPRLTAQTGSGPDAAVAERMAAVQKLVTEVRRFRADQGLRPGQWVPARLVGADSAGLGDQLPAVRALARLGAVEDGFTPTATVEVGLVAGAVRVELDTSGTIDVAAERARLTKDQAAAEKELAGTRAKLGNPKFTERAPADVVAGIEARQQTALADLERIRTALAALPER
jgi:anticodon-binding protein/RAD3-like DEAD/DEAH box helicase/valyl-tRNA synthetase-like protein